MSAEQYSGMLERMIKDKKLQTNYYDLNNFNCTTWVIDTLKNEGVVIDSYNRYFIGLFPGGYPGQLGESIRTGMISGGNLQLMSTKEFAKYLCH